MTTFGYTPPAGERIDLSDSLVDIFGAGVPGLRHQAVRTPSRDGEVLLRTVLEPRFLRVRLDVMGAGFQIMQQLRRDLVRSLNPKRGLGEIDYQPVAGGPVYRIAAVLAEGLGFDQHEEDFGEFLEPLLVSFRCPDPAWRTTERFAVVGEGASGLSIPMAIPLAMATIESPEGAVTNQGDLEVYPLLLLTGAFTGPRVENLTIGQFVHFNGLAVAAGETLRVDMDARTAVLVAANGSETNVMPYRTADSVAWTLAPGVNDIAVTISTGEIEARLFWADRYLGV
jgi:hypothetical protein